MSVFDLVFNLSVSINQYWMGVSYFIRDFFITSYVNNPQENQD